MRILYGVNGEGRGHISRALLITEYLRTLGHKVEIATYGDAIRHADIVIPGARFSIDKFGKVNHLKTIVNGLKYLIRDRRLEFATPDLVITDFEPLTARYAKSKGIPCISIDNQHRFVNIDYTLPSKLLLYNWFVKIMIYLYIGRLNDNIITAFHAPKSDGIVVQDGISNTNGPVIVYLKDHYLTRFLSVPKMCEAIIFTDMDISDGRYEILPINRSVFRTRFLSASGVVCNAGNQLISESIHYQKPLSCVPVLKQYEQEINAFYVARHKYGSIGYGKPTVNWLNGTKNALDVIKCKLKEYV